MEQEQFQNQNQQLQEQMPIQQEVAQDTQNMEVEVEPEYGPRKLTFFTLVLKSFAGFGGGLAGTAVLLLIFLATSSILQPVLGITAEAELMAGEISPLFMVVLMAMVFATSLVSSLLGPLFLAYTERDRYTRIATMMGQIFIINLVIFAFVLPIYLTSSTDRMELIIYAAGLQVILSATASAMIMELIHDNRYALLAVYNTILAILVAVGVNFFLYFATGNATILLFAALPIIWTLIGFAQAAVSMFYYWVFQTWGTDFLASSASFGTDYGIPDQSEEEDEIFHEDVEGADFFN